MTYSIVTWCIWIVILIQKIKFVKNQTIWFLIEPFPTPKSFLSWRFKSSLRDSKSFSRKISGFLQKKFSEFFRFFFSFFEVTRRFSAGREQVFGNIKSLELHRKDFNKDYLRSRSRTEHKRFLFWPSGGTKAGFPFVLIGGDGRPMSILENHSKTIIWFKFDWDWKKFSWIRSAETI